MSSRHPYQLLINCYEHSNDTLLIVESTKKTIQVITKGKIYSFLSEVYYECEENKLPLDRRESLKDLESFVAEVFPGYSTEADELLPAVNVKRISFQEGRERKYLEYKLVHS